MYLSFGGNTMDQNEAKKKEKATRVLHFIIGHKSEQQNIAGG